MEGARIELEGARIELEGARIELEGARIELEGARIEFEGAPSSSIRATKKWQQSQLLFANHLKFLTSLSSDMSHIKIKVILILYRPLNYFNVGP